ncbi:MAG TPA: hypothetical protein VGR70_01735 [Stellaceae bacterium]|nr:hypothetical protein [Stellaceae bacterium]
MSATCQRSPIEAIGSRPVGSWRGYLRQGNSVTSAILKMKAFLYSLSFKSPQLPPDPRKSDNPQQSGESEDYWNDPMVWMLMFH